MDSTAADLFFESAAEGLAPAERSALAETFRRVDELGSWTLPTGEDANGHAKRACAVLARVGADLDTRRAMLLSVAVPKLGRDWRPRLRAEFGPAVEELVAALASLSQIAFASGDGRIHEEASRRMILALCDDLRAAPARIASRTATLRHLSAAPSDPEAFRRWVEEAGTVYAPLAGRLGLSKLKAELEDAAALCRDKAGYARVEAWLRQSPEERKAWTDAKAAELASILAAAGLRPEISGRTKSVAGILKKMADKGIGLDGIQDARAFRVVVDSVADCYKALDAALRAWTPVEGGFDDYVARPKPNGYRSIHQIFRSDDGFVFELQIRDKAMHEHAEGGAAAHWLYKEGGKVAGALDRSALLRGLIDWDSGLPARGGADGFVYVLTPAGRVVDLPAGATALDCAYRIHSDLGHRCRGAKVDGKLVPLETPLKTGSQIEILSTKSGGPSRDWLSGPFLATDSARRKVRKWFADVDAEADAARGRAAVAKELARIGKSSVSHEELAKRLGLRGPKALHEAFARADAPIRSIAEALSEPAPAEEADAANLFRQRPKPASSPIQVGGVDGIKTVLALCCKPIPPDPIAGYLSRSKGLCVHRTDCPNYSRMAEAGPDRSVPVEWSAKSASASYACEIVVEARDRRGLLRDVSDACARLRTNIVRANTRTEDERVDMELWIEISGTATPAKLVEAIEQVPGVVSARRKKLSKK